MGGRPTRWKVSGSKLKEILLDLQIDKENKCKVSFREMTRTTLMDYLNGDEIPSQGMIQYWCKKLAPQNPYQQEPVTEKLAYKYAVEKGYWTSDEVTEEDFCNDTKKIKHKADESTIMRAMENEIYGHTVSEVPSLKSREEACRFEAEIKNIDYDKIREQVIKELESR